MRKTYRFQTKITEYVAALQMCFEEHEQVFGSLPTGVTVNQKQEERARAALDTLGLPFVALDGSAGVFSNELWLSLYTADAVYRITNEDNLEGRLAQAIAAVISLEEAHTAAVTVGRRFLDAYGDYDFGVPVRFDADCPNDELWLFKEAHNDNA